jgi:hypothetical protein
VRGRGNRFDRQLPGGLNRCRAPVPPSPCVHRAADLEKDPCGAQTTHQQPCDDEYLEDNAEHEVPQPADSGTQTPNQPGAELDDKDEHCNP